MIKRILSVEEVKQILTDLNRYGLENIYVLHYTPPQNVYHSSFLSLQTLELQTIMYALEHDKEYTFIELKEEQE